ncbi:MAG: alpha/beta hydrolase [Anaerolineaceae bacterium]
MMRHAGRPPGANDRVLKLPDGRLLGYAEFGDPAGEALFFFHESPGSRFSGAFLDAAAKERGLRVIALERPGFGLSDFQAGRTIADWPADVREASRHLGLEQFALLGYGAGAAYALACASALNEQVTAAGVVSSAGLPHSGTRSTLRSNLTASFTSLVARRAPALFIRRLARDASPADRAILSDPAQKAALLRSAREAFRHGSRGVVDDAALMERPWGIDFVAISKNVKLWHGEEDHTVPVAEARALAATIPGCAGSYMPGAGHLWLLDHGGVVLDGLHGAAAVAVPHKE